MKISAKGDYATRAVLDLAINHRLRYGKVSHIHEIAERQRIPLKYLENILLTLKKAGVLISRRGNQGGYYLARPPELITIGEVIRIVDGPLAPIECASMTGYVACPEEAACGLRSVWIEARNAIAGVLDNTSFADVLDRNKAANVEVTESKEKIEV